MKKILTLCAAAAMLAACGPSWEEYAGKDTVECGVGPNGATYTFLKSEAGDCAVSPSLNARAGHTGTLY